MNGFSHIEKGNILHNSLAAIWQQLSTQAALLALDDNGLTLLIEEHVKAAIQEIQRHKPKHLNDTLCQIECERQCHLIAQWLAYEKTRSPFTVVAIETAQTIHFKGVNIHVRIDRVDQLADGSFLIIDYKTGEANIKAWQGERPKEPQLPLYALTYTGTHNEGIANIKGISFAQININAQCFKGLGKADIAEGINSIENNRIELPQTWEGTLAHWQDTLGKLLKEFQQGDCQIKYLDELTKTYARDYLRINRFYEAEAMDALVNSTLLNKNPLETNTP
jgi:ATP-dependent helicase/nuclease subunit B